MEVLPLERILEASLLGQMEVSNRLLPFPPPPPPASN